MVNPIINGAVLVIFGLVIGAVLELVTLLSGLSSDQRDHHNLWKNVKDGRRFSLKLFIRESQNLAEQGRIEAQSMPRSAKMAMIAFYGLIIVLVLFVKYSPIEMNWLIFIGSVLAGFVIMEWVFYRAQRGKVRVMGRSLFDVLPDNEK